MRRQCIQEMGRIGLKKHRSCGLSRKMENKKRNKKRKNKKTRKGKRRIIEMRPFDVIRETWRIYVKQPKSS